MHETMHADALVVLTLSVCAIYNGQFVCRKLPSLLWKCFYSQEVLETFVSLSILFYQLLVSMRSEMDSKIIRAGYSFV
jgi:hypothetical protein